MIALVIGNQISYQEAVLCRSPSACAAIRNRQRTGGRCNSCEFEKVATRLIRHSDAPVKEWSSMQSSPVENLPAAAQAPANPHSPTVFSVIQGLIDAGRPLIYLQSAEEDRVVGVLFGWPNKAAAAAWTCLSGA